MVFSTPLFLFAFLPAFLLLYYLCPARFRNLAAMLGSLVFYAWGGGSFAPVLVASCAIDYRFSRAIASSTSARFRKTLLVLNLIASLALLAWFKYANFFVHELNQLLASLGAGEVAWTKIALPIGISFFTFHKISYLVDVYERRVEPADSFVDYLLYILLFPQLIAGPIVRYHDIDAQIRSRLYNVDRFWRGIERFTVGLAKKCILANAMAQLADGIYGMPSRSLECAYAWLGALAYFFQIYFDFSGYSDMAIGLGRMLGVELPENFQRPYAARTFTEFWRRWHISLSNFMRVYLYIPLGGNRVSAWRGYLNLWIVFLVSGLWHGASWNFIVWGAYQGVFLTLDKLFWEKASRRVPDFLLRLVTMFFVLVSWVFFRPETLEQSFHFLGRMFGITDTGQHHLLAAPDRLVHIGNRHVFLLCLATVICVYPWSQTCLRIEQKLLAARDSAFGQAVFGLVTLVLFVLAAMTLVNSSHNPFIYFRF